MNPSWLPAGIAAALAMLAHGCAPIQQPKPSPHYVLGAPYQAGTFWHYPRESFDLDETGLATVARDTRPRLTANGEVFDQTALAGAHPTVQLPAIARLTNLENGRQVTIRINDRGTGDPKRLIEVTKRTAQLLAMPVAGVTRVHLEVLPAETHAAVDAMPNAPKLAVAAAPRGEIQIAELAPPPGARSAMVRPVSSLPVRDAFVAPAPPPMRLPETVVQTTAAPGQLTVRLDTFDQRQYAAVQQAKMAAFGAHIVYLRVGRTQRFRVDIGPLPTVAQADAVMERALALGIPDARIVVD